MKPYRLHVFVLLFIASSCWSGAPPKAKWKSFVEVKLKVGETRDLHCNMTGDPYPTYTWTKYTYWWKKVKEFPTKTEVLRLEDVSPSDAGLYICAAENRLGKARHGFVLRVPTAPKIDTFKELDEPGKLYCFVKGYPVPNIIWERSTDDQWIVLENGGKYKTEYLRKKTMIIGYLTISSLNPADSGTYRCRAENSVGVATKEISVKSELK